MFERGERTPDEAFALGLRNLIDAAAPLRAAVGGGLRGVARHP